MAAGSKQPLVPDNIHFLAEQTKVANELDLAFS